MKRNGKDADALRAIVLARKIFALTKGEEIATVGTVLAMLLARWAARFPEDKQEEALDKLLTATAAIMVTADAQ